MIYFSLIFLTFFSNYRFPRHEQRRSVWINNMKILNWQPTANDRLCSKHFQENCFYKAGDKTRLLDDAVPTIFIDLPNYLQPKKVNFIEYFLQHFIIFYL